MIALAGITDGQIVRGEKTQVRAAAFAKADEAGQLAEGLKLCQEIVRELALKCGE